MKWTVLALSMVIAGTFVAPRAMADEVSDQIVGPWRLELTTPEGENREPIVVVGKQREKYVAWLVEGSDIQAFESAQLNDETLTLKIKPKERAGQTTVTLAAKLATEGKCQGEATYVDSSGETGSFMFKGTKVVPNGSDEVSRWSLKFTSPDNEDHEATVMVVNRDDKTYGWFSSQEFELPAWKMSIENNQIEMALSATAADGDKVDVTFRGTMNGDRVTGNAEYNKGGDSGTFPFTATKKS